MRRLPLLLLACLGCNPMVSWYLIVGQSNAVGASDQQTPSAYGGVYRAGSASWWSMVVDPEVFERPGKTSAWPSFAAFRYPRIPGLIAAAVSASCLREWSDVRPARWLPPDGDLYVRSLQAWADAGSPSLRAILWLQGECDAQGWWNRYLAGEPIGYWDAYDAYREGLEALAEAYHGATGAPLVAGLIQHVGPKTDPIRDAIRDAAESHPWILLGPETADLEKMPDGHVRDVVTLGARWAASAP